MYTYMSMYMSMHNMYMNLYDMYMYSIVIAGHTMTKHLGICIAKPAKLWCTGSDVGFQPPWFTYFLTFIAILPKK